jgi:signal transduction histidine kinase
LIASSAATCQIRQLTAAARRIAKGNYDRPSNVHGGDEIGDLGRAFEDMRLRIGEADRLKSAFISTVSHELRTPLAHIKGYSQLLLADAADEETRRDYLQAIDQASDRMTRLVNNMLDESQIEAGLLELFKEPVTIGPLLERQVEWQRTTHPDRAFALELAADLPTVEADPRRLAQVVRALLDNAVQYSATDAPVVVRSYVPEDPRAGPGGGGVREVVVEVEDHGIGITSDDQAHVFEPFYRVECGLDRRNQGSGLELAICRGIIKAHGGRVWLWSAPDQGSTFGFSLPIGPFSEWGFSWIPGQRDARRDVPEVPWT